jgi:ferredoxin
MMRFLKKLHKWVGLLIGIQVLFWLVSGLAISLLDPVKASGNLWRSASVPETDTLESMTFIEPAELPAELLKGALAIDLTVRRGKPVYFIRRADGESLVNAMDGSIVVIEKADAELLARQDFIGDGEIISSERGTAPGIETRDSSGAYWRVNFSDQANTAIYISASTGEILERRNSYWRIRDFFWMLHIMDYTDRENFNNPLIIAVALIAIWLGISGFLLLFNSFNRSDFFFLNFLGRRDDIVVTLIGSTLNQPQQVKLRKGSNLFLSLATHNVSLDSICGGGGECGKCRIRFETTDLPEANDIEMGLVPRRLRDQGYRLACQQKAGKDMTLHVPDSALVSDS